MSRALVKKERFFHETWLGMVQPVDGLLLSVPTLVEAQIAEAQGPEVQHRLRELLVGRESDDDGWDKARIGDLGAFLQAFLRWEGDLFVATDDLPEALHLYVPEGHQELRPTFALKNPFHEDGGERPADRGPAPDTPAAEAADDLLILVWQLPDGLPFDKPETTTGEWHYPPARKFERLLRHCRVPLGLLSNGEALRLVYVPHGESLGSITFRVPDMAQTGGRPILDALVMLLTADALFGSSPEAALPALCRNSRARQADVTEELANQVFEALVILLEGVEAAAKRGNEADRRVLQEALEAADNHLYGGLLAVLLRLVFVLYAEDNGILPTEHPVYQQHLSVLGLFAQLRDDAGAYPESMDRRFGAWPRLLALFRAIHSGLSHGELQMPPRRGRLFDPQSYPFLEGRPRAGALQAGLAANAAVRTPRVDDGTVYQILERLLVLEGQQLSYRSLDVEQIGSVYERLMGYRVERLVGEGVCVKAGETGAWLTAERVTEVAANQREKWLKSEWGLAKSDAKKLNQALKAAKTDEDVLEALETQRYASKGLLAGRRADGRLVIQPGKERIRTSSHYTPRTLSQPIVARTLEPVIAALGDAPSAEQLLSLKICDPAMGSGAFLVETCRYLGDQVVAAWAREGQLEALGDQVDDPTTHARRLVAQRCLYGVDKNRFAVDLARMSLWLVTLARDEPFTFVDHALRHGDSLVGLSVKQIKDFHWDTDAKNIDWLYEGIDAAIQAALESRERILELAREEGAGLTRTKESLLEDAEAAMHLPRLVGDALVGAWFSESRAPAKEDARKHRLAVVSAWLNGEDPAAKVPPEVERWSREMHEQAPVFHWELEFPEVFHDLRPDPLEGGKVNAAAKMDAFLGNPPFAGKNEIKAFNGDQFIRWLKTTHRGSHGNSDVSAHFFRRAATMLGTHGTIGFIGTNSNRQGDSRSTGLQRLVSDGFRIYAATRDVPWPGKASVTVDIVHMAVGRPGAKCPLTPTLDEYPVEFINSRLRPKPERPDPVSLPGNSNLSYQGSNVRGTGFVLSPAERDAVVAEDARNADYLFPYLGGAELNTSPSQTFKRFVISFGAMPLQEATAAAPKLMQRIRHLVKPARDTLKPEDPARRKWWQFERVREELYCALEPLDRCLACARNSKHLIFAWQPTNRIFSEKLVIFPDDRSGFFGVMQSRVHVAWAWLLSSTLKTDLQYTSSACFDTFAFPADAMLCQGTTLDAASTALDNRRAAYCIDRDQGLTDTYNDLKDPTNRDPDVERLRELHLAVDRAVIEAYGWQDVPVPRHLFPKDAEEAAETMPLIEAVPAFTEPQSDEENRALQRFEDAVIDKLFELNEERAAEEAKQAKLAASAKKKAKKAASAKKKSAPKKKVPDTQGSLF